jgi:hypothetical protein
MDSFAVNNCSFYWGKDSLLSEQDKLKIKKELSALEREIQETLEFTKKIYNLNNRTSVARLWLESDTTLECILTTYNDKGKDSWFMIIETVEMKVLCGISCERPKISYQTI